MVVWHFICHVLGFDYGLPYGHFAWYNLWSGLFGSIQPTLLFSGALVYWHHTCHESPWCLRWAKHPDASGLFRYCRHHHPELAGQVLTREFRHGLHHAAKAARQ